MCIHIHYHGDPAVTQRLEAIEMKLSQIAQVLADLHTAQQANTDLIIAATATTNKGIAEVSAKIDNLDRLLSDVELPAEAVAALQELQSSSTNLQTAAIAQKDAADRLDAIVPDAPPEPATDPVPATDPAPATDPVPATDQPAE